jgi:hypothetical protein
MGELAESNPTPKMHLHLLPFGNREANIVREAGTVPKYYFMNKSLKNMM